MLLTTKFLAPAYNARSVERRRLSDRLVHRHGRKLVVVTAPAGYGKTTLVTQWLHATKAEYCWLALDPSDNEPHRFWQYIVGTIHQSYPEIGEEASKLLAKTDTIPFEAVVTSLINDIAAKLPTTPEPISLILDDYHLITDPQIHNHIIYLISFLPPQLQVVLTTRIEPPLPIATWQVKNLVDQVYSAELAFSLEESEQFFSDYMNLSLSKEQIVQIRDKTEGWVAAMQLTALSAKGGNSSSISPNSTPLFLGEERLINDYVLSEILAQQSKEVQSFLLESSCLLRLNAELCNVIRETNDSQNMLERLVQANLFIIPLDTINNWFRYHDLFRESLFLRLKQSSPKKVIVLQHNAVEWLLKHNYYHDATAQLIQLEDWSWLKQVLEEHGNTLIHQGHHLPVLNWIGKLPESIVESSPRLLMLKMWTLFFSNRINAITPLLEEVEDLLDKQVANANEENTEVLDLHSELALIRSYLARTKSDMKSASHLTKQVLDELDSSNMPLKSVTYYGIGIDCYGQGDLIGATAALESAIRYGKLEKRHATILSSSGLLAWVLYDLGKIDEAHERCKANQAWIDAHQQEAHKPRLMSCWQNSALAQLFCEQNELTVAQTYINPLLKHLETGTEAGQHIVIQYMQGHIHFSNNEYVKALHCLDDALSVYQQKSESVMFFPPAMKALRIRCLLKLGGIDKTLSWIDQDWDRVINPLKKEQNRLTAARILIEAKRYDEAQTFLLEVMKSATDSDHIKHQVEAQTLLALVEYGKDFLEKAKIAMTKALSMAEKHGFLRLFREEMGDISQCIQLIDPATLPQPYIEALNATFDTQVIGNFKSPVSETSKAKISQSITKQPIPQNLLLDPLSHRELEVLGLINQGLANKEIANKLCLAPATIKAHIRNLYGKIEAKSRTEALAKARSFGLLN